MEKIHPKMIYGTVTISGTELCGKAKSFFDTLRDRCERSMTEMLDTIEAETMRMLYDPASGGASGSEMTDTDRIDFIQEMIDTNGCGASITKNTLIGSQPGMEEVPVQIFTIPCQHQYGKTVRDVIDMAISASKNKGGSK